MKDYSEYYTPLNIAKLLLNDCQIIKTGNTIDICCGSSNLLRAAHDINSNLNITGVDLYITHCDDDLNCEYIECDGRAFAINSYHENKFYDLVLANPPFEMDKENSYFEEICICDERFKEVKLINLLTEMILSNLLLLKNNSDLLMIVPSSVLFGSRFSSLRNFLIKYYSIKKIWNLPDYIFQGNEVDAYALLINNSISDLNTYVYENVALDNEELVIVDKNNISIVGFSNGDWKFKKYTKSTLTGEIKIIRGNISSNEFSSMGSKVLHVNKKIEGKEWEPKERVFKLNPDKKYHKVSNGEIIVSRIGRDAGYINEYRGESDYISDCLFVIRGIKADDLKTFLMNKYHKSDFCFLRKGTTSKYISKIDILKIIGE